MYPAYVAATPDETLACPHYSDERWNRPRLIYGKQVPTAEMNYSDRLWQWSWNTADQARQVCLAQGIRPNTARWTEAWLSAYHNRPVSLRYILAGVNLGNGYPYYVYGYDYQEPTPSESEHQP